MRILLLLIQYKPALNPNVYRWAAIAEHWAAQGHEVHVLCAKRHGTVHDETLNGVQVHRAGQASLLDAAYNWLRMKQRRDAVGGEKRGKKGRFRRMLEWMIDITWRRLYWPDGSCVWYFAAKRRAIQLQKTIGFDAVISVAQPFTPHLVAKAIKKRFPNMRWLMDIEDPFAFSEAVFINNRQLYQRFNYRQEGKLLSMADSVSVTVERARTLYLQHFPQVRAKIQVTPPMYSMPEVAEKFPLAMGKIHLAYFGAFYHPIRTPDALLKLFEILLNQVGNTYQLHFFGEIDAVFQPVFERHEKLKPHLKLHGLVTRAQVAAAMQSVNILINIGNTTDYHLPSKSVDYMMAGKPIINISHCEHDPFRDFFADYPLFLHLDMTKGVHVSQVETMHQFMINHKEKKLNSGLLKKMTAPYLLKPIAAQYLDLLQGNFE